MRAASAVQTLAMELQAGGHQLRAQALLPPGQTLAGAPAALVFLHEGLGSIPQWKGFPLALVQATGLPALIYDRYGHGGSDPLQEARGPHYLEQEAQVALPQVLATCGIQAPILIGHSDGATIALLFAAAFPAVPLAVVSEAAHVIIEPISVAGIRATLAAFQTTALRAQLAKHHGERVDSVFHGWSDVWLAESHHSWHMLDRLPAITAPVLAIQGEQDAYGTQAQVQAILDRVAGPVTGWMLPDCGHVPHFQAGPQVLARITAFIQSITRPSSIPRQKY